MEKYSFKEISRKYVVVGTGAAGFNAAIRLHQFGCTDVVILAENVCAGTSRNTGSDKQTYYKLSVAGADGDSIRNLAEDLYAGQCVDGDLALCEAALSIRSFYHLVELGVPFPSSEYGEFIGYKTDHDRGRRATSAGPYTSKIMTECLEKRTRELGIMIYDGYQVIQLLVKEKRIYGLLCLNNQCTEIPEYVIIWCENVIMATGGPAGMYHDSVYPASQLGSSGIAFEAGVKGKNLTEWQFGMASVAPRWNVSGTYMQVLPRFVSTDQNGEDEKEFLYDYFSDISEMLSMIFLKGYQWPFDTNKIYDGSSIIDLLVYQETILRRRRVFLDFRCNTKKKDIDFQSLLAEAREYLEHAGACFGTPIERLKHMNEPAITFYREHGVDLEKEMLEIAVCAQHNNGGLAADNNWQTDVKGLFVAGEICGSHGVTRPGGTALNAGQVGSYRAADYIAHFTDGREAVSEETKALLRECAGRCILEPNVCRGDNSLEDIWIRASERMSRYGGMIRDKNGIRKAVMETEKELCELTKNLKAPVCRELAMYYHLRDMLISQKVYLEAMYDYIEHGGGSRGSSLYTNESGRKPQGNIPELFRCRLDEGRHGSEIQEIWLEGGECRVCWRSVRPIPKQDYFFENQWRSYRERYQIP